MTNARSLAMRDPAAAALMGAFDESDFGADYGEEIGGEVSYEPRMGADFGYPSGMGWEDPGVHGGDFGASWESGGHVAGDFGAAAPAAMRPTPAQALQAWHHMHHKKRHRDSREALLYPNKGSDIKIEGYEFALAMPIVLGTASALVSSQTPDVEIRPRRVSMNAPTPGFVTFTQLQVANVNTLVGGTSDAYFYNANGTGQGVSYPTLSPSTKANFSGNYTGQIPPGFAPASAFVFIVEFKGPASMTA